VPQLGGLSIGGFNALFADGSVRFIKDTINPIVLKALFTRDGGEVISSDSF
jgi:prepilin-type processing-associated H-X9-DG protein